MIIDPQTGAVTFPSGYLIDSDLSQDGFKTSKMSGQAQARHSGTLPWMQYHLSCGFLEGAEVLVVLWYYGQMLVSVDIPTTRLPPEDRNWSNYSVDVEAATKAFHDHILERMLGKPTKSECHSFVSVAPAHATLACPHVWTFRWGTVCSAHNFQNGDSSITMCYGDRGDKARQAYEDFCARRL